MGSAGFARIRCRDVGVPRGLESQGPLGGVVGLHWAWGIAGFALMAQRGKRAFLMRGYQCVGSLELDTSPA